MTKSITLFVFPLLVVGLAFGVANAKKSGSCGELGPGTVASECAASNPGVKLHPCESWVLSADGCCEIDSSTCPDCYGAFEASVPGGGAGGSKIDAQIETYFLLWSGGAITDASVNSITVCPGTILTGNVHDGVGPFPSTATYNGAPLGQSAATGVFLLDVGVGGILSLDNLDNGGRDVDNITILVQ